MEPIPISFPHNNQTFSGYFTKVAGAGSDSVWHLHDDKHFFWGRLRRAGDSWVFDPSRSSDGFNAYAAMFADHLKLD